MPPGWIRRCGEFLDQFEPVIDDLHALLTNNAIFIHRMAGVGVMPAEMAIDYGCTGPVLRGSGVDWDLRRDGEPLYTEMYDGYKWRVIAPVGGRYPDDHPYPPIPPEAVVGDSWHRYFVRMLEVVQSMDIIRQGDGEIHACAGRSGQADFAQKEAAEGRGVYRDRSPEGADGLHDYQRRNAGSVAGADPQLQFQQSVRDARAMPRRVGGRRAGDPGVVGYRIGRD